MTIGPCALALLVLATGCSTRKSLPIDRPQGPPYCDAREKEPVICRQLERASFFGRDKTPLDVHLEECSVFDVHADVVWRFGKGAGQRYEARVVFTEAGARGPLAPAAIVPVFVEWPCPNGCATEDRLVRLPIVTQCEPNPNPQFVELTSPKVELARCADQPLFTKADDPSWCLREVGSGEARYRIALLRGIHRVDLVEIDVGSAVLVKASGRRLPLTEEAAADLRTQLDALWVAPTFVDESCRDGGNQQIEALRQGAWKVLYRGCLERGGARTRQSTTCPPDSYVMRERLRVCCSVMTPNEAALVKCLVAVAWADGEVAEPEAGLIESLLWAYDATNEEEAELREYAKTKRTLKQTPIPSDLTAIDREVALANAALLTHADGEQSAPEKKVLAEFAKLLGYAIEDAKPIIQSARQRAQALASKI